jgi:hypothetical protein
LTTSTAVRTLRRDAELLATDRELFTDFASRATASVSGPRFRDGRPLSGGGSDSFELEVSAGSGGFES